MSTLILIVFLFILAFMLIQYKPKPLNEGFAVAAVNQVLMPACTERSVSAQRILAGLRDRPESDEAVAELRLLISKLCCMEADIVTPAAGTYRTLPLQFRTSHDMEPASTIVGKCVRNTLRQRDIDLIIDKFEKRGRALVRSRCPDSLADFDAVLNQTRLTMNSFCVGEQPSMDKPVGARDVGFWASSDTDLMQYQGISATPK